MPARSRVYKTHAVVLRRRDYGDADRVLIVFTPAYGKRELIAHGIRKTTSRKAGHLELLTHASLVLAEGRSWDIVTEATTVEGYPRLRQDLDEIGRATYVCELVDRFTEIDDENRGIWDLLVGVLRELDTHSAMQEFDARLLLRWFELHLLSHTGFQPQFFHCLHCGNPIEPVANFISLREGGILCPVCGATNPDAEPISLDILKVLRHLQRSSWDDVSRLRIGDVVLQQLDNLLHRYLVIVLERRLVSVDFLRRLQALEPSAPPPSKPSAANH